MTIKKSLILCCLALGCSHAQLRQHAYIVGTSSKEVIDTSYATWDSLARERTDECHNKLPPEEHTKDEFDDCVGVFNESTQAKILTALKGVQSAQLALFVALSQDMSKEEVQRALLALTINVKEFLALIKRHQE